MGKRDNPLQIFNTPAWCVHRLLERVSLPAGEWLEPSAGDGAIVAAVDDWYENHALGCEAGKDIVWTKQDIRDLPGLTHVGDYKQSQPLGRFDVGITNPAFGEAFDFVNRMMVQCDQVALLMRVNWLSSAMRRDWLSAHMPDVYVLPNRPSFEKHRTDNSEYCWLHWPTVRKRARGKVEVLAITPKAERGVSK